MRTEQGQVVAAIGIDAGASSTLTSLRVWVPGGVERAAHIGGGADSVAILDRYVPSGAAKRIALPNPRSAAVVAAVVAECVRGAVLVTWLLSELRARLARVVPSFEGLLDEARSVVELAPLAALLGAHDDAEPAGNRLAQVLGVSAKVADVHADAVVLVRIARRLSAGGGWLARLAQLAPDERSILRLSAQRLVAGQQVYGRWSVNDGRAYAQEGLEEVIDALHYAAAELLAVKARKAEGKS